MAKKVSKRREWTKDDIRELKTMAKSKTPAPKIAKALKRSTGATRQKAFGLGVSLDSRRERKTVRPSLCRGPFSLRAELYPSRPICTACREKQGQHQSPWPHWISHPPNPAHPSVLSIRGHASASNRRPFGRDFGASSHPSQPNATREANARHASR
jgi:hypothetical protein